MKTVPKLLFLLITSWGSFANDDLPTITGELTHVSSLLFQRVSLSTDFPRYNVRGHNDASAIEEIHFRNSKLAVFSPDFCDTYNNLRSVWAGSTSVEVILPGSFDSCPKLYWVVFTENLIKEVPADLFRNINFLNHFAFDYNQLEKLPNNLLPAASKSDIYSFYLRHNNMKEFPSNIFNDHRTTYYVYFSSNDATNINATKVKENLPNLARISIGDNLIPCSRIPGIIAEFKELRTTVDSGVADPPKKRQQQVRWSSVEGITCVDDS